MTLKHILTLAMIVFRSKIYYNLRLIGLKLYIAIDRAFIYIYMYVYISTPTRTY